MGAFFLKLHKMHYYYEKKKNQKITERWVSVLDLRCLQRLRVCSHGHSYLLQGSFPSSTCFALQTMLVRYRDERGKLEEKDP